MIFSATKSALRCLESEILTSGMLRAVICSFSFSSDWDSLGKTAVFNVGDTTIDALVTDNNEAVIPWELLVEGNIGKILRVGVYGINGDGDLIIPTVYCETVRIQRGADPSGDSSAEPTPTIWEQMLADNAETREVVAAALEEITEIGDAAVAAKNAAVEAQGAAEDAQAAAEQAVTDAEAEKTAAVAAKNAAVEAQGAAEDAQAAAEQAVTDAEAEKTAAVAAKNAAVEAQGAAEDAQEAAEQAVTDAAAEKQAAIAAKNAAVIAQGGSEDAQAAAEYAQGKAEAAQAAAEAAATVRVAVYDADNDKYYIVSQRAENGFLTETFTEVET